MNIAYEKLSAVDAVKGLSNGSIDLVEYTEALIERTERLAFLNTYISHDPDAVRQQVANPKRNAGALHGLPFALKDIIDTADYPTTATTPRLRDWRPATNAPVAQALIDAGGVLMGKQANGELSFGFTGNSAAFGAVGNPYNPSMFPGGSSGGTAAGVAAGLVPAALGADTGGSCRMPASLSGCVGFRPTLGRYSQQGVVPVSSTRDTVGPLARHVADIRLIDEAVTGQTRNTTPTTSLKGLRLGVPRGYFYENLDQGTSTVLEASLARLTDAGAELVEADLPNIAELNQAVSFTVVLWEVLRDLSAYLYQHAAGFDVRELIEHVSGPFEAGMLRSVLDADGVSAEQYREAIGVHRPALQQAYRDYFDSHGVDALVVPTTALPARPNTKPGEDTEVELNGERVDTFFTYIRNCDPSSNAGLACLSVPGGLTADGLPVGVEFVGLAGSDASVLDLGELFEGVTEPLPAPKL